jgi:hypothetical protein
MYSFHNAHNNNINNTGSYQYEQAIRDSGRRERIMTNLEYENWGTEVELEDKENS